MANKRRETGHVTEALKANGYPSIVISNILKKKSAPTTPPPEELVSMFFKWADPSDTSLGFACLPYISGLTEPLTRLLRKNDIRVVSKPAKTLQQEFPSPKFRQPLDLQCNVVYKIPCSDCCWSYVGETGRCFKTRRKEHPRTIQVARTLPTMRGKTELRDSGNFVKTLKILVKLILNCPRAHAITYTKFNVNGT